VTRFQSIQTEFKIGIEPALDAASIYAEVLGYCLMRTAALGQQDDLGAVPQTAV
jgi:hypothetical protein